MSNNLAVLRSDSSVSVDMVLQRWNCLEHTWADGTLVRSLFWMCLEMSCQQVPLGTCIVAVVAHKMCATSSPRWADHWRIQVRILQCSHKKNDNCKKYKFKQNVTFCRFYTQIQLLTISKAILRINRLLSKNMSKMVTTLQNSILTRKSTLCSVWGTLRTPVPRTGTLLNNKYHLKGVTNTNMVRFTTRVPYS